MMIEFIGTPGAGKSTLVPVAASHMNQIGYQAYPVLDAARPFAKRTLPGSVLSKVLPGKLGKFALWQVFYAYSIANRKQFRQNYPALMKAVLEHQEQRPITQDDRDHVLHWFIHLTGVYVFVQKYMQPKDSVIFDEGFVHRVVQLFASEVEKPDLDLVASYLNLIPKPDLIIFTNTPVEICEERVFSRGVWERFRKKDPKDTSKFIYHASQVVNFSADFMRDEGWPLVEIDNGQEDLNVVKQNLIKQLNEMSL